MTETTITPTTPQPPKLSKHEIYLEFERTPIYFGHIYLSHYFRVATPYFHFEIHDCALQHRLLAVQAPRESAKSTILTFLHSLHGICFQKFRFIVLVQNTVAKAVGNLNAIKFEIKNNDKLKKDFPIELTKDTEEDSVFRHKNGFETRVLCKGYEQMGKVRGEKFGAYRPDLIIIDDLEDDELVRNTERRTQLQQDFDDALLPAGEFGKVKVLAIGTILHDDSLMAKLVDPNQYQDFFKLFYTARYIREGSTLSLWPEKWTVEQLAEIEAKKPATFAKEYMGDPAHGTLETIRREDFRYWKIESNTATLFNDDNSVKSRWKLSDCKAAISCDLAWEDKKVNDFSVVLPAYVTPDNDILVDDYICAKGMRPDKLEEIIFTMSEKYASATNKRVPIGFEKAKLEKVMKWFLSEAQRRRNKWLWLKDVNWGTKDKIERVLARLGNRFAQHSIFFKRGMGELENQLIRLRSAAHDDIADALGMIPELQAYPATKAAKQEKKDDLFEFLVKQQPAYRHKQMLNENYIFGIKNQPQPFKSRTALPV